MSTYDKITDVVIEELEKGNIPWRKPWRGTGGMFANATSKKEYRGMNVMLLAIASMRHGFTSQYWMTFNQAKARGGHVKAGAKGTQVIFWKFFEIEGTKSNGEKKIDSIPMARVYTVFNLEQTEAVNINLPTAGELVAHNPIEQAEKIVAGYQFGPTIKETDLARAYYSSGADHINIPKRGLFTSGEEFYSTLFHELTHSTGHERRLKREGIIENHYFGDELYSKEELIAEFGAAFLCGQADIQNIETVKNSAAYLRNWLKVLRGDKKLLISAAAQAQKAADHILGRTAKVEA
jgi:antirestriction protein ArdC